LTDLYEVWFGDAKLVFQPLRPLKKLNFNNPRWRTAAILKTVKSHISATVSPILMKFGMLTHVGPTLDGPLKFEIFENSRWRRPLENHKNRDISATV